MKGTVERDTIVKIVLLVIIIGIILLIAYIYVFQYYLPGTSEKAHITQLCPEWVKEGCSYEAAKNDLKITVDGEDRYLSELCEDRFGTDWYESCKEMCLGCP
jgi:hypothetical protein